MIDTNNKSYCNLIGNKTMPIEFDGQVTLEWNTG